MKKAYPILALLLLLTAACSKPYDAAADTSREAFDVRPGWGENDNHFFD